MKFTIFLCIAFSTIANGGTSVQTVDLKVENASFKSVVQLLQTQTGYSFIIKDDLIKSAKPVTMIVAKKDILEVLPLLFSNQPFGYQVTGKIVSIVPKKAPVTTTLYQVTSQPRSISGTVTDSLNIPLQNVTVHVVGTFLQTSTGHDGRYSLGHHNDYQMN